MMDRFRSYDINRVAEWNSINGGTCISVIDEDRTFGFEGDGDPPLKTFWALYGRAKDGLAQHIADRETKAECQALLDLITGGAPSDMEIDEEDLKVPFVILITLGDDDELRASAYSDIKEAEAAAREIQQEAEDYKIVRCRFVDEYWHGTAWRDALCNRDNLQEGGL